MKQALSEAMKNRTESMQEKLQILQQNRESEARLVHTLAEMRTIEVLCCCCYCFKVDLYQGA